MVVALLIPVLLDVSLPSGYPAGFTRGARDHWTEIEGAEFDPEKAKEYGRMIRAGRRDGLLASLPESLPYILDGGLDDNPRRARFCIETAEAACRTVGLIGGEAGNSMAFDWDQFGNAVYRAGWIALLMMTIRDNP